MAKLVEMVRNSPLGKRRGGGYSVLDTENQDPFVKGITFNAHFVGSIVVNAKQDTPEVQMAVGEACKEAMKMEHGKSPGLMKAALTVKANTLRVTYTGSRLAADNFIDYPIYLIAYCGGHGEMDDLFFFIHKTKIDRVLNAEIFKFSESSKVNAVTLTVAKAFNIAYKAWMSQKRKEEKKNGSESPTVPRKHLGVGGGGGGGGGAKGISNGKPSPLAAVVASSSATSYYTPPAPRKPTTAEAQPRQRSGSFGDKPEAGAAKNPAVTRAQADNQVTGSTHNVTLTDDFDQEFQELAETRARPELLNTSLGDDQPDNFEIETIRDHIDILLNL